MIQISRRNFLGGAAALVGAGGCRSLGIGGPKPNIVFGVISDIHITTPESTAEFRKALEYFRDRKADAVVVAGDLSDWGLKSGLKYVADAWYSVFPNDRAPDGRKASVLVNWTREPQRYRIDFDGTEATGVLSARSWRLHLKD
jgi:hypothetical protein